jgi:transcriptional regulator with XRE-family HTH domain
MAFRPHRLYRSHMRSAQQSSEMPGSRAGALLRDWRILRGLSQLELSLRASLSARHLSYLETGKAQPSREMILRLAHALEMPLRDRNSLLIAAGFAPIYPERELVGPELAHVRQAIDLIVQHHEPYPAFVLNRHWEILRASRGAENVAKYMCGGSAHSNMLRQFFDPNDLRAYVANWEEVALELLRHLQDAVATMPHDREARVLLEEVLSYPGVPSRWSTQDLETLPTPLLTVVFRKHSRELRFFSTIATFGTPRDVTLDELRIECAFPADDATAEFCKELAQERTTAHELD